MNKFSQWVLDVGDGKIINHRSEISDSNECEISIPSNMCNLGKANLVDNMIISIYPDFVQNFESPKYLSERAILTPTNDIVSYLNSLIMDKIPGDSVSYYSIDKANDFGGTEAELSLAFPTEYLNPSAFQECLLTNLN